MVAKEEQKNTRADMGNWGRGGSRQGGKKNLVKEELNSKSPLGPFPHHNAERQGLSGPCKNPRQRGPHS